MSRWPSNLTAVLVACVVLAGQPVRAQPSGSPSRVPLEITGATLIEYDDATGMLRAEGAPLVFTRGRTALRTVRLRYDTRARIVVASGGVEVTEPGLFLRAQDVHLRISDDTIRLTGEVLVRRTYDDGAVTLTAATVDGSLATRRFSASGAVVAGRDDWAVSGRTLDYDDTARLAVATGDPVARFKEATMTALVITLLLAEERARGEGAVVLRRGDLVGRAPRADISRRDNLAVLSGGAQVERGRDRIVAEVIDVDLDGARATARGRARVIFSSP